jgi:hypothetical protein
MPTRETQVNALRRVTEPPQASVGGRLTLVSMDDASVVLSKLAQQLSESGINASGPHPGKQPGGDYLLLADGKYMRVQRDGDGCWEALVHAGSRSTGVRRFSLKNVVGLDGENPPDEPTVN